MSDKNPRHDPEFSEAVGRAIKVLRTARDMSRRELAEAAGISYPYLSEIENGTKGGSPRALRPIAEALGVPLHELFATGEELQAAESSRNVAADARGPVSQARYEPMSVASPPPAASAPAAARPVSARRWFRGSAEGRSDETHNPHDRARLVAELLRLTESMPDADVERLLDLARRLSR